MVARTDFRFAVIGPENEENFRLFDTLKRVNRDQTIARFLEIEHAVTALKTHNGDPCVLCFDVFAYGGEEATNFVSGVRLNYPKIVFSLFVNQADFETKSQRLPGEWGTRFKHYYKLYKQYNDWDEFEPIVRASLRSPESEAQYNITNEPIRLTPVFAKGLNHREDANASNGVSNLSFLSYARKDWTDFVSSLVGNLGAADKKIWCDQEYIAGGDDWMDAIGQALNSADSLLLILSPDSLNSRHVKMEYRYFFLQEKPIIPVLYKKVDSLPFELATLHYVDFTQGDQKASFRKLLELIDRFRT